MIFLVLLGLAAPFIIMWIFFFFIKELIIDAIMQAHKRISELDKKPETKSKNWISKGF